VGKNLLFASQEPEIIQIFINTRKKILVSLAEMRSVSETEYSFICIVISKTLPNTVVKIASLTLISCCTNFARNYEQETKIKRFWLTFKYSRFTCELSSKSAAQNVARK